MVMIRRTHVQIRLTHSRWLDLDDLVVSHDHEHAVFLFLEFQQFTLRKIKPFQDVPLVFFLLLKLGFQCHGMGVIGTKQRLRDSI